MEGVQSGMQKEFKTVSAEREPRSRVPQAQECEILCDATC